MLKYIHDVEIDYTYLFVSSVQFGRNLSSARCRSKCRTSRIIFSSIWFEKRQRNLVEVELPEQVESTTFVIKVRSTGNPSHVRAVPGIACSRRLDSLSPASLLPSLSCTRFFFRASLFRCSPQTQRLEQTNPGMKSEIGSSATFETMT